MAGDQGEMTCREAGRKGGKVVRDKYDGTDYYEKLGNKGGAVTKARHGSDHYARIGKLGGTKTSERHGPEFYEEIGAKGAQRVKELVAEGRKLEEGG